MPNAMPCLIRRFSYIAFTFVLSYAMLTSPILVRKAQADCAIGAGAGWGSLAGAVVGGVSGFFIGRSAGNSLDSTGATGGTASGIGGGLGAVVGLLAGAITGVLVGIIVGAIMCAVDNGSNATYVELDGELMQVNKKVLQSAQQEHLLALIDYQIEVAEESDTHQYVDVTRSAFDAASIRGAWGTNHGLQLASASVALGL